MTIGSPGCACSEGVEQTAESRAITGATSVSWRTMDMQQNEGLTELVGQRIHLGTLACCGGSQSRAASFATKELLAALGSGLASQGAP